MSGGNFIVFGMDGDPDRVDVVYTGDPANLPPNLGFFPFEPEKHGGDRVAQHYKVEGGELKHDPPQPSEEALQAAALRAEIGKAVVEMADNPKASNEDYGKLMRIQNMSDKVKQAEAWTELKSAVETKAEAIEEIK